MSHRTIYLLISILTFGYANSQAKITLRKSFVDSFKNKVTITSNFSIFYSHAHANDPEDDGDLHFSGYDKKIGMPIVAEIMNAADEEDAIDTVKAYNGDGEAGEPIEIAGAWRLWAEHIKSGHHYKQGMGTKLITSTGPPHVFEIHPITSIKDLDLIGSLKEIEDFDPYPAQKAFRHYTSRPCTLTSAAKTITLKIGGAQLNYADFWIKLLSTEKFEVDDGLFVYCDVLDSKFKPEVHNVPSKTITHMIRMAFPKDSEAYEAVKNMNQDEFLHVVGIPRISLVEISKRVKQKKDLKAFLPVEMIIVGIIE